MDCGDSLTRAWVYTGATLPIVLRALPPLSGVFCFLRFSLAIAEGWAMGHVDRYPFGRYVGLEVAVC